MLVCECGSGDPQKEDSRGGSSCFHRRVDPCTGVSPSVSDRLRTIVILGAQRDALFATARQYDAQEAPDALCAQQRAGAAATAAGRRIHNRIPSAPSAVSSNVLLAGRGTAETDGLKVICSE